MDAEDDISSFYNKLRELRNEFEELDSTKNSSSGQMDHDNEVESSNKEKIKVICGDEKISLDKKRANIDLAIKFLEDRKEEID